MQCLSSGAIVEGVASVPVKQVCGESAICMMGGASFYPLAFPLSPTSSAVRRNVPGTLASTCAPDQMNIVCREKAGRIVISRQRRSPFPVPKRDWCHGRHLNLSLE